MTTARPNIVLIICDDLGYGDVQCLNPERGKIPTPRLDSLAAQSMTFTDAHSCSSVCSPSRYGLLTGRYAWRSWLQGGVVGENRACLITEDRLTVQGLLQRHGYHTACIGKWHLGYNYVDAHGETVEARSSVDPARGTLSGNIPVGTRIPDGPVNRGFDVHTGFHRAATMSTLVVHDRVAGEIPTVEMLPYLGRKACEYIEMRADDDAPFFLYLPLNSPHGPIVPAPEWQGRSGIGDYGDFVMQTDAVVGDVLDALDRTGLAASTLVLFTSDNGCSGPCANVPELESKYGHYPSAHLRGYKADIWDGGHRIPLFIRWPGRVQPGSACDELICLTDFTATVADMLEADLPDAAAEDSTSFLPALAGQPLVRERQGIVHHSIAGKFSIRSGKWKLELCPGSGGWTSPKDPEAREAGLPDMQLYDMEADVAEQNNVVADHPDIVQSLLQLLTTYVSEGRSTSGTPQPNDVGIDLHKTGK